MGIVGERKGRKLSWPRWRGAKGWQWSKAERPWHGEEGEGGGLGLMGGTLLGALYFLKYESCWLSGHDVVRKEKGEV
jgi:hypothetical protein